MFYTKIIKISNIIIICKRIKISNIIIICPQNNPMSSNIKILIKIYDICPILYFRLIISRINTIKSWFILTTFLYFKVLSKDKAVLKIHFVSITSSYNSFPCSIYSLTFTCSIYSPTC